MRFSELLYFFSNIHFTFPIHFLKHTNTTMRDWKIARKKKNEFPFINADDDVWLMIDGR